MPLKKVVPDFRHGENVHCNSEIFPTLKLRHLFTRNISKHRHMKYNIGDVVPNQRYFFFSRLLRDHNLFLSKKNMYKQLLYSYCCQGLVKKPIIYYS